MAEVYRGEPATVVAWPAPAANGSGSILACERDTGCMARTHRQKASGRVGLRGEFWRRASLIAAFLLLATASTAFAADGWVLWRHYVPLNTPELDDAVLWRAEPGTKTQKQCETELREDVAIDPNRGYRIEYRCLRETMDPREPKSK